MESYNLLLNRYKKLLNHYKHCKCDCPTNLECQIIYRCLLQLLETLRINDQSLGVETIGFLKPPEEPKRCTGSQC
jgi:hypothetical protein